MAASPDLARRRDRLVGALALLAVLALALGMTGAWLPFGVVVWAMLMTAAAVGFANIAQGPRIALALCGIFLLLGGFTVWAAFLHRPDAPLETWGGFPLGTAVLVYGIWPFAALTGLLYVVEFERSVLPEERLRRFQEKFSRRKS